MNFPKRKIVLVTGANGQLGQEFRHFAEDYEEFEFLFAGRDAIDITNEEEVLTAFQKFAPDICINCAAYTAVDRAEEEEELAHLINATAIEYLIKGCKIHQSKFVNFSTDYVYDSVTDRPLLESDPCTPRSVYGQSKRAGEILLENSNIAWLNFRVSWLYSVFKNNFVKTMLRLGTDRDGLSIVADQIGSPTYARDLAHLVIAFLSKDAEEQYQHHYNFSNAEVTNWADFAREIFRQAGLICTVNEVTTDEYGAAAPRPLWSVMDTSKVQKALSLHQRDWPKALSAFFVDKDELSFSV